jgi:hypothetical protein
LLEWIRKILSHVCQTRVRDAKTIFRQAPKALKTIDAPLDHLLKKAVRQNHPKNLSIEPALIPRADACLSL